jgi:8-oxo-dGTP pyrophosphatase MutT (NUDIX family)
MHKDEQPGKWDTSAAGHVDSGEDYRACAVREIREELGIAIAEPLEELFKLPASARTGYEHCMVYRCDFDGPLELDPDEIDDGRWISPAEMDRRVDAADPELTEAVRLIWREYRRRPRDTG